MMRIDDSRNQETDEKMKSTQEPDAGEKEDYHFIREVIKEKPVDRKKVLIKLLVVIGCALLFGTVSAFTFAKVLPYCENGGRDKKVEIPACTPESTPTPSPTQMPTATPLPTPAITEEPEQAEEPLMTIGQVSEIYKEAMEIARKPEKSLVSVKGVTSNVDWMDNEYENYKVVSGFLAAENEQEFFVFTEYRAVENADRIMVTFADGADADAVFLKQDPATGFAVLTVSKAQLEASTMEMTALAEFGSSAVISRGMPVLALGSPAGYSSSVSYGMITSVNNTLNTIDRDYNILTTDIMGTADGSGVLVNINGEIVGVIAQSIFPGAEKNIVISLPVSEIRGVIEKLSNQEDIVYIGVKGQNITSDISKKTGIPEGVYVNEIREDSPAMVSGLSNGDVITFIGDKPVKNLNDLSRLIDEHSAGEKISVTAMRKGAEEYVEIVFDVIIGTL